MLGKRKIQLFVATTVTCCFFVWVVEPESLVHFVFERTVGLKSMTGCSNGHTYKPQKTYETLKKEQTDRRKVVQNYCKIFPKPSRNLDVILGKDKNKFRMIIVDDKNELLYCNVPKVACVNWKLVLLVLTGKANTTQPADINPNETNKRHYFRRLNNYTTEEILYRLERYTKFMFVRHPFERFLSAYRNKFSDPGEEYFLKNYGRQIIKKTRINPSEESLNSGRDVTYREFAKYNIDPELTHRDDHWAPMMDLCIPCAISYDVIGKYETLEDDAWFVLQNAGVGHRVRFPNSRTSQNTRYLLPKFMKQLSSEEIRQLFHVYKHDFWAFGYDFSEYLT